MVCTILFIFVSLACAFSDSVVAVRASFSIKLYSFASFSRRKKTQSEEKNCKWISIKRFPMENEFYKRAPAIEKWITPTERKKIVNRLKTHEQTFVRAHAHSILTHTTTNHTQIDQKLLRLFILIFIYFKFFSLFFSFHFSFQLHCCRHRKRKREMVRTHFILYGRNVVGTKLLKDCNESKNQVNKKIR